MATHSSILAWKNSWTQQPGRLSMGSHKSYTAKRISLSTERMRKEKQASANSHIFGSEGQLLFDTVLISGEDQIF